ncbi:hypothetical protein NDU88_009096 [Pleurodeles waltl]|uniref:Uncharacterized protein n=1 Tax=Pleurodeles waltl TaxID=8319 RepID=A0AAV7PR93_PLEWA|nr:hypothetical protein NDU88_009096 [Pleurodeles waltl]
MGVKSEERDTAAAPGVLVSEPGTRVAVRHRYLLRGDPAGASRRGLSRQKTETPRENAGAKSGGPRGRAAVPPCPQDKENEVSQ